MSEPLTFAGIYREYAKYVAGVSARMLGRDDADVDDVVQEVFWITSRNVERIHDMAAARPWLLTVTVRVVRSKLRRRRWRSFFHLDTTTEHVSAPGCSPSERALLGELYRALAKLPDDERIAWTLRHVEGERLQEVADACNIILATAKRKIAAAEEVLDEVLRDA